ncbi:M20/M25/M40 family metallo-hydrolase [Phenylobacterium immobile]|uniref:M20/M25/M40 family metallo-hydrolase n=1 Tax=Phenylobacterium immobile TaxID=21 RepID=UPI000A5D1563|nr:M20/M25/M40 family metallo-hydrolase [Phenylobacterium immobile]
MSLKSVAVLAAVLIVGGTAAYAQAPSAKHVAAQKKLMSSAAFAAVGQALERNFDQQVADWIMLTEIAAPPFKEEARGKAYLELLKKAGLSDVQMDEVGNVYGVRKGLGGGGGKVVLVTAHLDTVFPEGTDVKVKREGAILKAPGIGDDTAGLASLLAMIRALDAAGVKTQSDIVFMGDVGEEGPGDLRGMRHLFTKSALGKQIKYFIAVEPGTERLTAAGPGSKRYRLKFKGPGGHSFGAFGLVNPAYAMGNFLAEFGKSQVPTTPKTTFNIGSITGGTSVNSIPFEMTAEIDMRSDSKAALDAIEQRYLSLLQPAADAENAARSTQAGKITIENTVIGDRPVGETLKTAEIVQVAMASMAAAGVTPSFGTGSTDSNIPMSMGIPAITIGSGFDGVRAHSLDEAMTIDKAKAVKFMTINLATIVSLAGAAR